MNWTKIDCFSKSQSIPCENSVDFKQESTHGYFLNLGNANERYKRSINNLSSASSSSPEINKFRKNESQNSIDLSDLEEMDI